MPQALNSSTARLGSGARATLELVDGTPARRPMELTLRRLPAIIAVLLLAAVILTVIGVLVVLSLVVRVLAAGVAALGPRPHLVALR
jgi:hypothetical protein